MGDLDAAIEAAMHAMYGDHPHAENYRAHVQVGIAAAAPLIGAAARADERAKALEEAARAIEARKRPGITAMLEGGWNQAIEVAAGVARETAFKAPESPAAGREGQGEIGGKHEPSGHATADDRDDRQEQ